MMYRSIVVLLSFFVFLNVQAQDHPENHVYQYSIKSGSRRVYLWVPPDCKKIKGVIIALSNLLERKWLEDPIVRNTASDIGLGIIWIGPAENGDQSFTADMKPGMEVIFQKMMDDLAEESGYTELATAPVIPTGHSANGQFAWTFANAFPNRTIAAMPIKTMPLPDTLRFKNIPLCYIVGETTEWPQFRVPDPATQPGDRDYYWPVVKNSALALRAKDPANLVAVITDPGGGHFDWSKHLAQFVALFIRKACQYRLPANDGNPLLPVQKESGWLTGTGGMDKDDVSTSAYSLFENKSKGYWFFDKETAFAALQFEGDRIKRKKQMPTFIQDGKLLPVAKRGYAELKFDPAQDGLSFDLKGGFLSEIPPELMGAGQKIGHAKGPLKFSLIKGPAIQTGKGSFKIQFDRGGIGGELWIQEEHDGNREYRHAVQPGMMRIPAKLTKGKPQEIMFPKIGDLKRGTSELVLQAISNAGLPVDYYVVSGPAYIDHGKIKFVQAPVKSKYPVKVIVVAYQWGRTIEPFYQSAEPVEQIFYIK